MNRSSFLVVALLAACSSAEPTIDDDGADAAMNASGKLSCVQAESAWNQGVVPALLDLTQCTRDDECTWFSPNVDCGTLSLRACPVAIRRDAERDVRATHARTDVVAQDICERVEPGCVVRATPCGAVIDERCNQGHCELTRTPLDDVVLACDGSRLVHPERVKVATPSPDGKGWCCAASLPTCDCGSFGGFVEDRCECGEPEHTGPCDLAPPDWISETDAHGCQGYTQRAPTTACCNCPPSSIQQ